MLATAPLQSAELFQPGVPLVPRILLNVTATLLLGGYLVFVAPWYVDDLVDELHGDPLGALKWGIALTVGVFVAILVLVLSGWGYAVGMVLIFLWQVFRTLGFALGCIAVLGYVYDSQRVGLLFGAVLLGGLSVFPLANVVLGNVIGLPGVGAMVKDYYE